MSLPSRSNGLLLAAVLVLMSAPRAPAQEPPPPPKPGAPRDARVELLAHRRARLGVSVSLRARDTDSIGAFINSVTPGGPAAKAGIRSGDVITRLGGKSLVDRSTRTSRSHSSTPGLRLIELAAKLEPNDTVAVEFRRGAETKTATLVASEEPDVAIRALDPEEFGFIFGPDLDDAIRLGLEPGSGEFLRTDLDRVRQPGGRLFFAFGHPLADLELAPINADLGRYFGVSNGILVISVPEDSKLNLKGGDVVLSVDGRTPSTPAHLLRILRSYEPGEEFKLEIMRMKKKETVVGKLGEKEKNRPDGEQ